MTYAEYKAYMLRALWRDGDTALIEDFDTLVTKAETRINRDLRRIDATKTTTLELTEDFIALPDDYVEAVSVLFGTEADYAVPTTIQQFNGYRSRGASANFFTIKNNQLHVLHKASATAPLSFEMTYYYKAAPFRTDPTPSFYEGNEDFYEAAVRVQCYDYLREFELSSEYNGKYSALLEGMERDQARKAFPAGAIYIPLPGIVA